MYRPTYLLLPSRSPEVPKSRRQVAKLPPLFLLLSPNQDRDCGWTLPKQATNQPNIKYERGSRRRNNIKFEGELLGYEPLKGLTYTVYACRLEPGEPSELEIALQTDLQRLWLVTIKNSVIRPMQTQRAYLWARPGDCCSFEYICIYIYWHRHYY